MTRYADLHIHTYFSDSSQSPHEVIEQARSADLSCIAITDHDNVDGIGPAIEAAKRYDIEVIPGIELSCETNSRDIHILGYLFDYKDKELKKLITLYQDARMTRMEKMIAKLKNLGIGDITLEQVCAQSKSKSVGRPHLATLLLEKGHVSTMKAAFDKYLGEGGAAYETKFKQTPQEAIALINKLGGVSVLAHPMHTQRDEIIPSLVEAGLKGIEVYYPNNTDAITGFYEKLAKKHNLIMTGGSDAHGEKKRHTYVGKTKVPYELVEKMKNAVGR